MYPCLIKEMASSWIPMRGSGWLFYIRACPSIQLRGIRRGAIAGGPPFLSGNRKDLEGRNEGLVAAPEPSGLGDSAGRDGCLQLACSSTDYWCSGGRPMGRDRASLCGVHVLKDDLDDRFYSNAGCSKRVSIRRAYRLPGPSFVPTEAGEEGPQVAYNVFEKGRWNLHISVPGSTEDAVVYPGLFLWNIQDLDGNGTAEWVISPGRIPRKSRWTLRPTSPFGRPGSINGTALSLLLAGKWEGVIPYLLPRFRSPNASTYRGTWPRFWCAPKNARSPSPSEAAQEARSSGSRSGSRFFQLVHSYSKFVGKCCHGRWIGSPDLIGYQLGT